MDLSNTKDIQMTYLSLKPTTDGLEFTVDGKSFPNKDLQNNLRAIVNFVSTMSLLPIVAKIEILDKDEYYILSLNIPILPAFIDIKDPEDIAIINSENYAEIAKKRVRSLNVKETEILVNDRVREYMNYIQHEFAGAHIKCRIDGQEEYAELIANLPFMRDFDLSSFSPSHAGKNIYKTPQFLRCNTPQGDMVQSRDYYMGLQEKTDADKKDKEFWTNVYERDKEYVILDESMNFTIEQLKQKYGEIEFLPPTASSQIEETPSKQ